MDSPTALHMMSDTLWTGLLLSLPMQVTQRIEQAEEDMLALTFKTVCRSVGRAATLRAGSPHMLRRALATEVVKCLALLARKRQMVDIGAFERGSHPALDAALAQEAHLSAFLRQAEGGTARTAALQQLAQALGTQA